MVLTDSEIQSKQDMLMGSLKDFFSVPENLGKMIPILTQKSKISLRLLDWFVTNYAKKKNIGYFVTHTKGGKERQMFFNVYLNYKSQLKAYSKQLFDPFCRKWKIMKQKKLYCGIHFYYKKDQYVETTVGQLNFFRWVIQNKVLDYAIEQLLDIQRDMLLFAKKKPKSSNTNETDDEEDEIEDNENVKEVQSQIDSIKPMQNNTAATTHVTPVKPVENAMPTTSNLTTPVKPNDLPTVSINATKKLSKKYVKITVDFN